MAPIPDELISATDEEPVVTCVPASDATSNTVEVMPVPRTRTQPAREPKFSSRLKYFVISHN